MQAYYGVVGSTPYYYTTTNAYEDTGTLITSTDSVNGATTYGYDSSFVYQTSVTPPSPTGGASLASGTGYDTTHTGLVTSASDPNATTYVSSYDSMLRPTEVDYPDASTATMNYTPNQTSTFHTMSAGTTDTETFFDAYGRTSRTATANGQSVQPWYLQDTCYDANGNVSFKSYPYQASSNTGATVCSGAGDTYSYDSLGRLTYVQHADSPATHAAYTYWGRTIKSVDENGVTKLTQIDGLGRISALCEITSVTMPGSGTPASCGMDISATGYLTTYNYDLANHTTTIIQGGQTRVFTTDWLGRLITVQEPESGTTTYAYGSNSTGATVTRVKPRANQTSSSVTTTTVTQLDKAGRVVSITYDDGTPTKSYAYDQSASTGGGSVGLGYSKGYLTSYAAGGTQGFYGYDKMGRITLSMACQPANCSGGAYTSQGYTYDGAGNMLTAGDGTGRTTTYTYTLASEPSNATSTPIAGSPATLAASAQYGPFGLKSLSLGNGLTPVNGFDAVGRRNAGWLCSGSSSANCVGGTQTYGMSATWSGNRLSNAWDSVLNQILSFGYDDMNRLSSRTVTTGASQNFTYAYDRWGNRTSQVAASTGPTVATNFNMLTNQITSVTGVATYVYDAAGNVLSDGTYTYSYDAEGNMTGVSGGATASYVYDALNERVKTVTASGTQQYVFHPSGQRASILDGSGAVQQNQVYWGAQPLAFYKGGSFHYQQQDWLGTERVRTTAAATVEGTFSSLPFGDYAASTGTDNDPSHYTGLDHDAETNSEHAQFRQYSSLTGTWMRPDPYSGSYDPGNPQSLNRYVYVLNNPLTLVDPLGLWVECGGNSSTYHSYGFIEPDGTYDETSNYTIENDDGYCVDFGGGNASLGATTYWSSLGPATQLSQTMLGWIASCEGFRARPYDNDGAANGGNCTVGYGQLLHSGRCTSSDNQSTDKLQALEQLKSAMGNTVAGLLAVQSNLSQQQLDALASAAMNIRNFWRHDVGHDVRIGSLDRVPSDLLTLTAGGRGIKIRRNGEASLFETGFYPSACHVGE